MTISNWHLGYVPGIRVSWYADYRLSYVMVNVWSNRPGTRYLSLDSTIFRISRVSKYANL